MPSTQPARGMRDFLPSDVRRRQYVIGVIADVYQRYGFEPLETPALENIETLLGKYGDEGDKLIFKILKRGEQEGSGSADLALRYDLTVPLARVVAEYGSKLPRLFKRFQVQPVWRADRPQRGRFREFYQCDVDAIGSTSMVVEAELLTAAADVFARLGFGEFTFRLNHRKVLAGVLQAAGIPAERHADALMAIDKLEKIGVGGVVQELDGRGIRPEATRRLLELFAADEGLENTGWIERLYQHVGNNETGRDGVADLHEILRLTSVTEAGRRIRLDPSVARGLSYYTGAVFEVTVPEFGASLAAGGRYDNLIGLFRGDTIPACGISLGLERILVLMTERGMFPSEVASIPPADVMLTLWNADRTAETLALAAELRREGLRVDVYPEPDKLGKQVKYASSRGVPFVAIMGDDEALRGEVSVRDLTTGEQTTVARVDVARYLRGGRAV